MDILLSEVARLLGVGPARARAIVSAGRIPGARLVSPGGREVAPAGRGGGRAVWLVPLASVKAFAAVPRKRGRPRGPERAIEARGVPLRAAGAPRAHRRTRPARWEYERALDTFFDLYEQAEEPEDRRNPVDLLRRLNEL